MEKRRQFPVFLVLLLGAALVLLLMSTSSPLYPTNPWVDANCYVTVGRGMRAGLVPYRDLIEQKGPLLYGLHYLAALVSPNGFLGVYLLETLACALFLFASYRTVRLYEKRGDAIPLLVGVAALLACSMAFVYGDSAEEFCTPLLAWSLYDALRYFRDECRMTSACLLRNGILAGCVLWIKYSLIGLHFAWMAVIAIDSVVRERKLWPAVRMCLIFLGGMALSTLPWIVYFGANGALGDLFGVYFLQNLEYKSGASLIVTLVRGLGGGAIQNPLSFLLIAAGFICVLLEKGGSRQKICLLAMFVCLSLLVYFGGRIYRYTFYVFSVFVPLGVIALVRFIERFKRCAKAWTAAVTALMCVIALLTCPMLGKIGFARAELVQTKFAREINRTENATLLNLGFLDGGFYLAADVHPGEKQFVTLNVNKGVGIAAQAEAVEAGRVDYVVTQGEELSAYVEDVSGYELILEGRDEYSKPRDQENYFLYRKLGLELR